MSDKKPSNLKLRIISAVILAIPTLAAIYYGSFAFDILISICASIMAWEWSKLCLKKFSFEGILLALACGLIPFAKYFDYNIDHILSAASLIFIALFLLTYGQKGQGWFSIGIFYIALPILSFDALRIIPEHGLGLVLWVAFSVWATDTGGYFFGRSIGGPKLAPKVSPKKTWAGLLGGMASASLIAYLCALSFGWAEPFYVALLSAALAVIAQMGDLFESHAKRRFDVKDSSNIIPGHGGVLDRLDGMMFAAATLMAIIYATNGSILTWL